MKKNRYFGRFALTLLAVFFALWFLLPTVLTITNSFMTQSEISANYGKVFANVSGSDGKAYIADEVNLKFIPDKVTFHQYIAVLIRSPEYLLKFWNSVILVVPIVLLQLVVAWNYFKMLFILVNGAGIIMAYLGFGDADGYVARARGGGV